MPAAVNLLLSTTIRFLKPTGIFWHTRPIIVQFLNQNAKDFLEELKQRVKAIDPDLAVTINFSCHYPQEIRDMLDYQFSEPLLKDNWFSSAYARDTAIGQYPILVPGEASQVYNYSSVNEYICDLSSIGSPGLPRRNVQRIPAYRRHPGF